MRTRIAVALIVAWCSTVFAGVPTPLPGDKVVDVGKIRENNPAVISTDGAWRFKCVRGEMKGGKFVSSASAAEASSEQLAAGLAIDGKPDTRWCAAGESMPQWWQVDLGKPETIKRAEFSWEYGDGKYTFKVDTSADAKQWATVAEKTGGDGVVELKPTTARYVRVTITAAELNGEPKWASIREVNFTVERDGKDVPWTAPVGAGGAGGQANDEFAKVDFDDRGWNDIPVPSNWEVLGYSKPTYFGPDNAVGLYRRVVDIPADWAGKKIFWHCDGVTDSAEVWVDGKRAGYHEGGFTAFDMDLSDVITPGKKNLIAVRVCKTTPTVDLDTGDYWLLGGIHRESHLVAVPADHIQDVTVVTKLDDHYVNATLLADVVVNTQQDHASEASAGLFKADGTPVDVKFSITRHTATAGGPSLHIEGNVLSPLLWSAEKPNLYYLLITLKSGATTETVEQRIGFRQVEIKDGVLLLNGVPIKCCGTCRHEEWAALGHALTEHEWQTDVAMMKGANINAVRTSHYNHAERFLELCDEKGLYVLDEIPACWVSNKDPKLTDAFVQHAAETLARDKNKPSVIAWSCGNESGWGPNFKAMVDYVQKTDPTRPRFVSQVHKSQDPNLSFDDYHYPGDNDLRKLCMTPGPAVITEGPHIFYNIGHQAYDYGLNDLWGEALAAQWDRVWPSKYCFGAFIWEWQDQGLADKYEGGEKRNDKGLRLENSKGIVTGFREPKPEYYHVKMVYSPVVTDQREVNANVGTWSARFQNRYAFTDLSDLKCHWQAMTTVDGDKQLATGDVSLKCPPGESSEVKFPTTASADTLRVSFNDSTGTEIYAVRLAVLPIAPQPPAIAHAPSLDFGVGDDHTIRIRAGVGNKLIAIGPTCNLGEARFDDGDFGNKNDAPWIGSKKGLVLKNMQSLVGPVDSQLRGTVSADVALAGKPDVILGRLTYSATTRPGNEIDWHYKLTWLAEDMQAWEFGLKFDLPGDDQFSWYRKAQWTEYPAGHVGADRGSVSSKDRSFDCTKRDTIWAAVTGKDGGVAVLATDGPLHTRCNFHDGVTTLFASSAVSVDRDFSSGFVDNTRIRFKTGHTYEGAFRMRLTAGK